MTSVLEVYVDALSAAIALEAIAYPKPGNVHRLRSHSDKSLEDYILAAIISRKHLRRGAIAGKRGAIGDGVIGGVIASCIRDIVRATGTNTSLGTILLLTPIAVAVGTHVSRGMDAGDPSSIAYTATSIVRIYSGVRDSISYYQALRTARPSYLRETDETAPYPNIHDPLYREKLIETRARLWDILVYASRIDVVSREVTRGYPECVNAISYLRERLLAHNDWNRGVVETYLYLLSRNIDTVVALKHGRKAALAVSRMAHETLESITRGSKWPAAAYSLDNELYSRGINPGSTADMIACTIALYLLQEASRRRRLWIHKPTKTLAA